MTNQWQCYTCGYIGPTQEFVDADHICPKCKSEDVFPDRIFKCNKCGQVGSQVDFFGLNCDLDPDPIEEKWEGICPNNPESECEGHQGTECDASGIDFYIQIK